MEEIQKDLEEPQEPPIMQKEKKPRSPAQIEAFQKARDKRLQLAAQKKIDQAKAIEKKIPKKKIEETKPLPSVKDDDEEEPEVVVVKKPKKKKIIYQVESDSEEEVIVKTKKKDLPPAPPKAEPIKLPSNNEKPKPIYVFL